MSFGTYHVLDETLTIPYGQCFSNCNARNHGPFQKCLTTAHRGSLVDGGAPYSAIGMTELYVLRSSVGLAHVDKLHPIHSQLSKIQILVVILP